MLEQYMQQLPGVKASYPFGKQVCVYKVVGKMFALLTEGQSPQQISLKALPADVTFLIDQFEAVGPGYHLNKKHWITISLNSSSDAKSNAGSELSENMLQDLVNASYALVVAKLTRADKALLESVS